MFSICNIGLFSNLHKIAVVLATQLFFLGLLRSYEHDLILSLWFKIKKYLKQSLILWILWTQYMFIVVGLFTTNLHWYLSSAAMKDTNLFIFVDLVFTKRLWSTTVCLDKLKKNYLKSSLLDCFPFYLIWFAEIEVFLERNIGLWNVFI